MKTSILLILLILPLAGFGLAAADPGEPDSNIDGARLYQEHCASCHGKLEETYIPNRRASRIVSAIKHFGAMSSVRHLDALQIIEIAKALRTELELVAP